MFKDEAIIEVKAGKGGDGCVSFRREYKVPKGGPDGGDGGRGGDVILIADPDATSLIEQVRKRRITARDGGPGTGSNCTGANADTTYVRVPVGTVCFDSETNQQIADLTEPEQQVMLARGGKGGRGNKAFASATHQTPRDFEWGFEGEQRNYRLELKLIADVGLVGMPNAGKSTLLSRCSAARPKIADYPFTTLGPLPGIVELGVERFVMADIPGLIEGASEGKGLGHQFLRHIERTRVIVHLVDLSTGEVEELAKNYRAIRHELESFSPTLAAKQEIIVGNKVDIPEARERLKDFAAAIGKDVVPLSGVTGENLKPLLERLLRIVRDEQKKEAAEKAAASSHND